MYLRICADYFWHYFLLSSKHATVSHETRTTEGYEHVLWMYRAILQLILFCSNWRKRKSRWNSTKAMGIIQRNPLRFSMNWNGWKQPPMRQKLRKRSIGRISVRWLWSFFGQKYEIIAFFMFLSLFIQVGRTNLKGISNGIILANLSNLSGCMVVVTYAGWIFKQVGAAHNPNTSAIAIAVTQIIAIFCTSQLCDSLGRKALLKFSFLGCASGLLSFAMYSYLKHQGFDLSSFEFVPVASLSIVILTAASGIVPLMPICTIENLPSEVYLLTYDQTKITLFFLI